MILWLFVSPGLCGSRVTFMTHLMRIFELKSLISLLGENEASGLHFLAAFLLHRKDFIGKAQRRSGSYLFIVHSGECWTQRAPPSINKMYCTYLYILHVILTMHRRPQSWWNDFPRLLYEMRMFYGIFADINQTFIVIIRIPWRSNPFNKPKLLLMNTPSFSASVILH